jgi:hypothetical protein
METGFEAAGLMWYNLDRGVETRLQRAAKELRGAWRGLLFNFSSNRCFPLPFHAVSELVATVFRACDPWLVVRRSFRLSIQKTGISTN